MSEQKSGCNECVMSDSKWDFVDGKYELVNRTCKKGNTEQLVSWWENNGNKRDEPLDIMECHEYSQSTKRLNDMSTILDKMLNAVKDIKDEVRK